MEKYIVYITINLCNGKFYIGVHKTNPDTFDGYIGCGIYSQKQAIQKYPFHTAVRKYGYNNFKRTTIKVFNTEEEAYAFEKELVTGTLIASKNCYNIQCGGLGETGYTSKRVYQFDLKGGFLRSWKSASDAEKDLNLHHITAVCRGERTKCGNFYWSYIKKFDYTPGIDQSKCIAQYSQSGKFIRTWNSQKEAQYALGIYNINRAIKTGILCGGYQWREFNGDTSNIKKVECRKFKDLLYSKIIQKDLNNNVIKIWNNIEELHVNGFNRKYIRRALQGKINTYKGFKFEFYKDEDIVSTSNENQSC